MTLFKNMGRRRQPPPPVRLPAFELGMNLVGISPDDRRDGGMGPLDARFDPCGAPPVTAKSAPRRSK